MGEKRMLEDDRELELDDLDNESEQEASEQPETEHVVPDTDMDRETGEPEQEVAEAESGETESAGTEAEAGELESADTEAEAGELESAETENELEAGEAEGAETEDELEAGESESAETENELEAGEAEGAETENELEAGEAEGAETEDELESGEPETAETEEETEEEDGENMTDLIKGGVDSLMSDGMKLATKVVNKHKDKFFSIYDSVMDLKDEMHYARKDAGGGLKGIKSAAGVLGKRIKGTGAYQKFMKTPAGRGIQAVSQAVEKFGNTATGKWLKERLAKKLEEPGAIGKAWDKVKSGASYLGGKIKSGASKIAEKFNGTRLGKWIQEKRANKSDKPGFFGKMWNKVKSGASVVGNKIKSGASKVAEKFNGTRLGKWIQEKRANKSDEPGVFKRAFNKVKTGVGALADKVKNSKAGKWAGEKIGQAKEWIAENKDWVDEKMDTLREWKRANIDEPLDNHEHERRVRFMERRGDSGYGQRYQELVENLKSLPGIERLKGIVDGKEIEKIVLELEEGKESLVEKAENAAEAGESAVGQANDLLEKDFISDKIKAKLGDKRYAALESGLSYGQSALSMIQTGSSAVSAKRLSNKLKKMQNGSSDRAETAPLSKGLHYAKAKADKDVVTNAFSTARTAVSVAGDLMGHKTAAKVVNKVTEIAEGAITSSMDKETRKGALKGLLGGVEGYKQMKAKYKLKAPEMRRAIRQAIGVSSEEDVANVDRMATSEDIMRDARDGDEDSREFLKTVKAKDTDSLNTALGSTGSFTKQSYA